MDKIEFIGVRAWVM